MTRFYLDEDLSQKIAAIARARGVDVISSHEHGQNGTSDADQLLFAARDHRCLVTRDFRGFTRLTRGFLREGRPHAGVVMVPTSINHEHFSAIADAIVRFATDNPDGFPPCSVVWLSAERRNDD